MIKNILVVISLFMLIFASHAYAVDPDEVLSDPVLEERAREISKGLRCVVCKNQSIDESDASLAKDLRMLVRDRLEKGDTDQEVIDYVVGRYGEFVLLKPTFSPRNLFLWLAPILVMILGGILAFTFLKQQRLKPVEDIQPLSDEEKKKLDQLLVDE